MGMGMRELATRWKAPCTAFDLWMWISRKTSNILFSQGARHGGQGQAVTHTRGLVRRPAKLHRPSLQPLHSTRMCRHHAPPCFRATAAVRPTTLTPSSHEANGRTAQTPFITLRRRLTHALKRPLGDPGEAPMRTVTAVPQLPRDHLREPRIA